MDMFDFFFPEQAEAAHLRRISRTLSSSKAASSSAAATARRAADEVVELRSDVKFLTLVLTAVLKRLTENETMSLTDAADLLDEIDRLDGVADAGLDTGVLRGMLGVVRQRDTPQNDTPQNKEPEADQIDIVTTPYRPTRYRRR